jgi:hypothetical protein
MPIHFEEVSGEIEAPQRAGEAPAAAPSAPAGEDLGERLERALRLQAERAARLRDD